MVAQPATKFRMYKQRFIIGAIIMVLVVVIILILYFKLVRSR